MSHKVISKLDAIRNESGGPKTTQQEKAIKKSAITKTNNFWFLEKFFNAIAILFIIIFYQLYWQYDERWVKISKLLTIKRLAPIIAIFMQLSLL